MKLRWIATIAFPGYPILIDVFIYSTWFVATLQLSRIPIPYDDDPKFIGGATTILHSIGGLYMIAGLLPFALGATFPIFALFFGKKNERKTIGKWYILSILVIILSFLIVKFEPSNAVEWYFD